MQFSVWNWEKKAYDVFEGPGEKLGQRPQPRRRGLGPNSDGQYLESLLPVLPATAKLVETRTTPVGRIAIHHTSSAVSLDAYTDPKESPLVSRPWLTMGVLFGSVYAAYRLLVYVAKRL